MTQKKVRPTGTPALPSAVKPAEPEVLDAAVIAYLQKQASNLTTEIEQSDEQIKMVEQQMMTQFHRNMGQFEGRKAGLEAQLKALQEQLNPPSISPPVPSLPPTSEPLTVETSPPIM